MENKLEKLTQKLYQEGLSKGRDEAHNIVAEAKTEAAQIVDKAKAEAAQIVADAKKSATEVAKNSQTEIALASKQAVATLKESIAQMIIAKSSSEAVAKATLDSNFVKEILLSVAKNWNVSTSGKVTLEAILPAERSAELKKAIEASAKELLSAGIEVGYSDKIKSGFRIAPKGGGYYISFTDADFDALLSEYLRPKLSQILYGTK